MMSSWRRESLNLEVGDWIIWRDEAIEAERGLTFVRPGMKGKVVSLHDGFHLDVIEGDAIPPKAVVEFENRIRLMVDGRMNWERITS